MAVGTVTITERDIKDYVGYPVRAYIFDWTSHTDGTVSGTTKFINGTIVRVVTNPGATAPTDNYDVTLLDEDSVDVFCGEGADRDTANSEQFCPGLTISDGTNNGVVPPSVNGLVELQIANAGSTKQGIVTVYVR